MGHSVLGLFAGAVGLGLLHGLEPGHGWPVAAAWALGRPHRWRHGVLGATVIGLGHLASSIAVVLLFFAAKEVLALGAAPWIDWVAGGLLLALAVWQAWSGVRSGSHHHHHHHHEETASHEPSSAAGLGALTAFAFTLGFAHEEEFQILALCAGSRHCLALMMAYAVAVIIALVVLTLLLMAGLRRLRHRLEHMQRALTFVSAAVLALLGAGFLAGVF